MRDITCILHIGAPKCGSSALQSALSAQPDLSDETGQKYRYTVYRADVGQGRVLSGRSLRLAARTSPYGYASWPNIPGKETPGAFWAAMRRTVADGHRRGYVPILSNEGWIAHAEAFAAHFPDASERRIEVIAFVRPPLEWLNAAYWQWGVWSGLSFDVWLSRPAIRYRLGEQLEAWSRVPGVRLRVQTAKQDVTGAFAGQFGLALESGQAKNASAPPALIGFLLRNRRFRPTAHDSAVEFVFQRWCRVTTAHGLWGFKPRQVQRIRADLRADVDRLLAAVSPVDAEALLTDPRWYREAAYHDRITAPTPALDDPEALAELDAALRDGLEACAAAAGTALPALPSWPAASASLEEWDAVVARTLEALLDADRAYRLGRLSTSRLGRWLSAKLSSGPSARSLQKKA
ncbi:hypothetical protein SAMN04490248_12416 [Salinihabitans flavidus]|uniref:Sulfotransferase family protein n=1 Tax=Salinihabitans flavidus TaxID=569882 RepID=A0A1H8V118_9RHOB|nr:hypothetical protein [Salinihabitans flavidus]SEP09091.1 hypothetical protein SAMN04490248_12416 [Salinihabitans flavidus]